MEPVEQNLLFKELKLVAILYIIIMIITTFLNVFLNIFGAFNLFDFLTPLIFLYFLINRSNYSPIIGIVISVLSTIILIITFNKLNLNFILTLLFNLAIYIDSINLMDAIKDDT